jgi:hypothetical protein
MTSDRMSEMVTSMPFALPMIWRGKKGHLMARCFCLTNILVIAAKSKRTTQYPVLPSVFTKGKVMYKVTTKPNVVH